MLFQTAPLLPGTTRVHLTVVRAKGVRNKKTLPSQGGQFKAEVSSVSTGSTSVLFLRSRS